MKEIHNANAQAVLAAVQALDNHPTASAVYETVRVARPHIGLASVYRILHTLAEQGYIQELGRDAEGCRYDGRTSRHDHAVCTTCGALLDIPIVIPLSEELLQTAAQETGITLTSHEVRLYGTCHACHPTNR